MTPRELATLRAALLMWSERNVPASDHDRKRQALELDLIATGGRQWPALDAEECDALAAKLREDKHPFDPLGLRNAHPHGWASAKPGDDERTDASDRNQLHHCWNIRKELADGMFSSCRYNSHFPVTASMAAHAPSVQEWLAGCRIDDIYPVATVSNPLPDSSSGLQPVRSGAANVE